MSNEQELELIPGEAQSTELIIIEQLPIIRQTLEVMSAEIKKETDDALALLCIEGTVKLVKDARARITKKFNTLEDLRIAKYKEVIAPYEELNGIYKKLITEPYKASDALLKGKIDTVENQLKQEKEKDAMRYFAELTAAESVDFVSFEQVGLNITLTVTLPALKKQIAAFISRINEDLLLIDTQGEHKNEIMVEYKRSLNVSKSITDVVGRHKALEEEKARQIEREAARASQNARVAQIDTFIPPPMQAPRIEPQAVVAPLQAIGKEYSVTFKVWGTVEKLKAMKAYLIANELRYENVSAPVAPVVPQVVPQAVPEATPVIAEPQQLPKPDKIPTEREKGDPVAFVQFRNKEGEYGGREYSYVIPEDILSSIIAGSFVDVATKHGIVSGLVTRLGTTADVAAEIIPKLMKLEGITAEKQEEEK
jgi:hypothetical protein